MRNCKKTNLKTKSVKRTVLKNEENDFLKDKMKVFMAFQEYIIEKYKHHTDEDGNYLWDEYEREVIMLGIVEEMLMDVLAKGHVVDEICPEWGKEIFCNHMCVLLATKTPEERDEILEKLKGNK